jgi:hypothetical protein
MAIVSMGGPTSQKSSVLSIICMIIKPLMKILKIAAKFQLIESKHFRRIFELCRVEKKGGNSREASRILLKTHVAKKSDSWLSKIYMKTNEIRVSFQDVYESKGTY